LLKLLGLLSRLTSIDHIMPFGLHLYLACEMFLQALHRVLTQECLSVGAKKLTGSTNSSILIERIVVGHILLPVRGQQIIINSGLYESN
jgi:hypothetical protein